MTAFLKYTAIRVVLFAVPFGIMFWAGWDPVIAGLVAVLIAGFASYIFFNRQRDAVAHEIAARAERRRARLADEPERPSAPTDEDEEDALFAAQDAERAEADGEHDGDRGPDQT